MAKSSKGIQLIKLKDMISQLNTTIKMLNKTISKQQSKNESLKAELAWFRQKMFGSSSERRTHHITRQLNLFGEIREKEKPINPIEPETVVPAKKKASLAEQFKDMSTRQVLGDTLINEDKICPLCSAQMQPIGTEVIRSEIVCTPPKLERIGYIATTYAYPE